MKNLKKAAWTTLAVLSSCWRCSLFFADRRADCGLIKYGYRSTDLKYVACRRLQYRDGCAGGAGDPYGGKDQEKQPALSGAPLQVSDMRREPERKIYRSAPCLLAVESERN